MSQELKAVTIKITANDKRTVKAAIEKLDGPFQILQVNRREGDNDDFYAYVIAVLREVV